MGIEQEATSNPMNAFAIVIIVVCTGLPIAWFASEYQERRWLRLVLGCLTTIVLNCGIAAVFVSFERFNSNSWFGNASKELVDATVAELEAGNEDGVLRALKGMKQKYSPTYENRARYDVLVNETVTQMRAGRQRSP
jgi:hypothetical protein